MCAHINMIVRTARWTMVHHQTPPPFVDATSISVAVCAVHPVDGSSTEMGTVHRRTNGTRVAGTTVYSANEMSAGTRT